MGVASTFDYHLPDGRIAQYPADRRDDARTLIVPREGHPPFRGIRFGRIGELFEAGDLLVLNETRVLPARLIGRKPSGAAGEVLLLRPTGSAPDVWEALVRPGSKLKPGRTLVVADDLSIDIEASLPSGGRTVRLRSSIGTTEAIEKHGRVPLPPYVTREPEPLDRDRYQTVYAQVPGSVAAPTAGLHFTPGLLGALEARGVTLTRLTLHVGVGTFRPVEVEDPSRHVMHEEWFEVSPATARAVDATRSSGGKVWAVGTTVARALEAAAVPSGRVEPAAGMTDLFIRPPYEFRAVDALITNFHLPRSTLLMLVAAFAGTETVLSAYDWAVRDGYRFYSYGDAMVLL